MIKLSRNPANNPFQEPYMRVRTPAGGDVDLAARRLVRTKLAQSDIGFKSDPYVDDPAAQSFNNPNGVNGFGTMYITGGAHKLGYFRNGGLGAVASDCASGCLVGGTCAPAQYCKETGPNGGIFDTLKNLFSSITGAGGAVSAPIAQRCGPSGHWDYDIGACAEDKDTDVQPAYTFNYAPGAGLAKFKQQAAAAINGTGSFADLVPTLGLVGGGIGVVYGLMKHKPKIAMIAGAIGVAALVLPKMLGGPLAGAAVAFEDR